MTALQEMVVALTAAVADLKSKIDSVIGEENSELNDVLSSLSSLNIPAINNSIETLAGKVQALEDLDMGSVSTSVEDLITAVEALEALDMGSVSTSVENLITAVEALELYVSSKRALDFSPSLTLNCAEFSVFNKPISGEVQFILENAQTGDEGTIFCAASGNGSLNPELFDAVGKQVTTFAKIDIYEKSKKAIITYKVLFADETTVTLAYTVWQPLS